MNHFFNTIAVMFVLYLIASYVLIGYWLFISSAFQSFIEEGLEKKGMKEDFTVHTKLIVWLISPIAFGGWLFNHLKFEGTDKIDE